MTANSSGSVADVYNTLKATLDIFKVAAPDTAVDVPSKQMLVQAAEQIKTDAAKIGLLCSGGAPPQDQQVSLAAALQRSCIAFCTVCHALTAAAGPSLKASLVKLAQDMVNPCLALVKDMGSGKDLKNHVGLVWERVSSVSKAPLDNKACLFAGLAKVMAVMKDTLREMEELEEEQQEEYGQPEKPQPASHHQQQQAASDVPAAAAAGGSSETQQPPAPPAAASGGTPQPAASTDGASNGTATATATTTTTTTNGSSSRVDRQQAAIDASAGADLDFEADQMGYWERQLLAASSQLLQASAAVLKAYGRALLQGPGLLAAGSEVLEGWESAVWHTQHLRRAVEDLGAAMYPPQDLEEVGGASLAVFEVTELMADECPDPEGVGADTLSSLNQQLAAAHQKVQQLLQEAAGAEGQEQQSAGDEESD